jgi:hypothetical protein
MKKKNLNFEDFGVNNFTNLSTAEINNAVAAMVETLNLGSGSTNTVQLYNLMQLYLKDIETRNRINDVLFSSPMSSEGNVDILRNRQVITFYSQLIKNFIFEFDNKFLPELIG